MSRFKLIAHELLAELQFLRSARLFYGVRKSKPVLHEMSIAIINQ